MYCNLYLKNDNEKRQKKIYINKNTKMFGEEKREWFSFKVYQAMIGVCKREIERCNATIRIGVMLDFDKVSYYFQVLSVVRCRVASISLP